MARPRKWARSLGLAIETTFGTYKAPTDWIPGKSTMKTKPPFKDLENPVGVRGKSRKGLAPAEAAGGLSLEVIPGGCANLLQLLDFVTGSVTQLKSASVVEMLGATEAWVSTGLCANKFALNMAKGEDVIADLDCFAQQRRRAASIAEFTIPTPSYEPVDAPYVYKEFTATLDNNDEDHVWTAKLEIDQMLKNDEYQSDGTGLVAGFPSDGLAVSLTLDHLYEHANLYDAAIAGTEMAWEFVLTRGTDVLTVTLPRMRIVDGQDPDEADTKQALQLEGLVPFSEAGAALAMYSIVASGGGA